VETPFHTLKLKEKVQEGVKQVTAGMLALGQSKRPACSPAEKETNKTQPMETEDGY